MTADGHHVHPIGRIRTGHGDRTTTPVQTALNPTGRGSVELDDAYAAGLEGLDEFEFAWLITWLAHEDPGARPELRQVPFLLRTRPRELGLFAMRGPRRPNPLGLHLVRIVAVTDAGFDFAGVDMVDGTPVLDVKPFADPLDLPFGSRLTPPVRSGWFDGVALDQPFTPADPPPAAP